MVLMSKPTAAAVDHFSIATKFHSPSIPSIDISKPNSQSQLVKACEDFGFFKVVNHGIPSECIAALESKAFTFFSLPLSAKEAAAGYGNSKIGCNGDVGCVEYLLLPGNREKIPPIFGEDAGSVLDEYVSAVKRMACVILEMVADGLKIEDRDVFSKLLMDEESDSVFRLNHYPELDEENKDLTIGFGEHTDPQIISILRSNHISGLEISLKDGDWISIPPDQHSFFINVGDSLQVMTNGRLKSVRHRVARNENRKKSRLSMIYFGGPPLSERIAPLPSLLLNGSQDSLYNEFTWFEYKTSAFTSRLADNRLGLFQKLTP